MLYVIGRQGCVKSPTSGGQPRCSQLNPRLSPIFVALLMVSAAIFVAAVPSPSASANAPTQRLGFWLQDSNSFPPAQTFFNAMFLTPPYPSSMEVMIFAPLQDQINGYSPSSSISYTTQAISYWGQIAQMADSYPNIRLVFDVAFNPSSSVYGLSDYLAIVNGLSKYSSVYGMGVDGEYTPETLALMTSAMSYVKDAGKLFVNYYATTGDIPTGGYAILHTNFPEGAGSYDQVGTLQDGSSQAIGLDSGFYASFPYPGTSSCPIGPSAVNSNTAGWNQCVISTEISAAASFSPSSERQFLELCVGFSSSGSFTGVSGETTNQLWDNPTLRNWIWTAPSYQGNFILSTGSDPATTTTSTTVDPTTTTSTTVSHTTTSTTTTTSTDPTSASYTLSTYVQCPEGIAYCGGATPVGVNVEYSSGTQVKLMASSYGGFELSSWSVCTSTCTTYTANPLLLTITADTKVTANFISG